MILCFEISHGRYLNDTGKRFEKLIRIFKIEDETNEIPSKKKDETNTVDINDKLQLSKIEKEKVILISDDDRNTYKEK
jgi:hypothetical protein